MNIRTNKPFLPALLLLMFLSAPAFAQQNRVNLTASELTVGQALEQIKSQTGYLFSYNTRQLDLDRVVKFSSVTSDIDQILDRIIENTGLTCVLQSKFIVIRPAHERELEKPVRPIVVAADVDSRYVPSDFAAFNGINRRRPLPPPVIDVAEETVIVADTTLSRNEVNYMSYVLPAAAYLPKRQPVFALKMNMLYGLGTLTPNLAAEVGLGGRTSLELSGSYNPWKLNGTLEDNRKIAHYLIRAEFRYWLCERFGGHFFGVHAFFGGYNTGSVEVPLLFDRQYRYEGNVYGAGVSYGYHLMLSRRWGLEFNVGVGVAQLKYDRFPCASCSYNPEEGLSKTYFGPTRAGVTLVFNIR